MTYIRPIQNSGAPLGQSPFSTLKTNIVESSQRAGINSLLAVASPVLGAAGHWGLLGLLQGEAKFDKLSPLGDPYDGYSPESESCKISVYGEPVWDGAVMTHCMVRDAVDYHSMPTSALDPASLSITLRYQVAAARIKGKKEPVRVAKNVYQADQAVKGYQETPEYEQAFALVQTMLTDETLKGDAIDDVVTKTVKSPAVQELLKKAAFTDGKNSLSGTLNKIHVGEHQPKTLELQFVLHDTIYLDKDRYKLAVDRFTLLLGMRRLFCVNPQGMTKFVNEKTLRSVAAKISAESVKGRIVELKSKGIDPYGVSAWLTTSFEHREVPDSDVIAVKIVLREFESLYTSSEISSAEKSGTAASSQMAPQALPAPLVRPSYPAP